MRGWSRGPRRQQAGSWACLESTRIHLSRRGRWPPSARQAPGLPGPDSRPLGTAASRALSPRTVRTAGTCSCRPGTAGKYRPRGPKGRVRTEGPQNRPCINRKVRSHPRSPAPAPRSCRLSAPTRAEPWLPWAWVCAQVTRSSGARPGAMTVQFRADAGGRLQHQENWEVRDKGKHRERKEF